MNITTLTQMTGANNDAPPTYDEPSAADEIFSLFTSALAVQSVMANARDSLKHVDGIAGTNLHARLLQADEKYLDVLNESRTAANKLYSVINTFVTVILPIAQDTQYPLAQRLEIVKSSADKIAHSAKEHLHPYDRKFSALSGNLEDLKSSLVEADKRMRKDAQEPLKDLMSEIESIEDNLKQNTKIFDRLSSKAKELISTFEEPSQLKAPASAKTPAPITPAVQSKPPPAAPKNTQEKVEGNIGTSATSSAIFTGVKMLGNFFEGEAALSAKQKELEAKVVELATTRKNIAETSAEIAAVIVEISTLIKMFSGIIGKLGHFGAIWNKVVSDSAELSEYLAGGEEDEEAIMLRVKSEAGVYDQIKLALDEYCLRT